MIRRNPTRIELKLDDLQDYENMRRQREAKKEQQAAAQSIANEKSTEAKSLSADQVVQARNERIGYVYGAKVAQLKPSVTRIL